MPTTYSPFDTEQRSIEARRKLAEALRAQSMEPIPQQPPGVRVSPFQGIAKMLQAYSARRGMDESDEALKALGTRRNEALAGALSRMPGPRSESYDKPMAGIPYEQDVGGVTEPAMPPFSIQAQRTVQPTMQENASWMGQLGQVGPGAVAMGGTMLGLQQKQQEGEENRATRLQERILTLDAAAQNAALSRGERTARALEAGALRRELADDADRRGRDLADLNDRRARELSEQSDRRARDLAGQASADRRAMAGIVAGNRQPQIINTGSGPMVLQGTQAVPITGPAGTQVPPASGRGTGKMSAAAQKELIQTDEELQGGQAALGLFTQAKAINDKAMGFTGAGAVASAGSLLPEFMRPSMVDATQNLDNMLQSAALPQLKSIFGGMPTEGERKILLDVQGSSSKPPAVRKEIFDRAEKAIQARMKFAAEKAKALRAGTYFKEDGAPATVFGVPPTQPTAAPSAPTAPTAPRVVDW
mgnify:CR=1 FL=1